MRAANIMTPHVLTVGPETSVKAIAELMADRGISGVPVLDETQRIVGIVTEGDLIRRIEIGTEPNRTWRWPETSPSTEQLARAYVKSRGRCANDVMSRDVVTVSPNTEIGEIAALLESRHIKRVPVIKDGKLVGIVSRANLIRALACASPSQATSGDQEISGRLLGELKLQEWARHAYVSVVVKHGVVHLWGTLSTDTQHRALRVAAENVPGVSKVVDHTRTAGRPAPNG